MPLHLFVCHAVLPLSGRKSTLYFGLSIVNVEQDDRARPVEFLSRDRLSVNVGAPQYVLAPRRDSEREKRNYQRWQ